MELDSVLGFMVRFAFPISLGVAVLVFQGTVIGMRQRADEARADGTWTSKGETRQALLLLLVYGVGLSLFLVWMFASRG